MVVLGLGRSGCSLEGGVMVLSCSRWGSESEAFAFQSRTTSAIHDWFGSIRRGVENSAIGDGPFHIAQSQRNTIWAAYSLISA